MKQIALLVLLSTHAFAATRARYGGTLKVAVIAPVLESDPLLADTPAEAALIQATSTPLCLGMTWTSPTSLQVTSPRAAELQKNFVRAQASPYRGLVAVIKNRALKGDTLELSLSHPFPELAQSLCSPVLSVQPGPFALTGEAQLSAPTGRAFADRLVTSATDERGAGRKLALRQAQLVLGANPLSGARAEAPGAALYSTFLFFQPQRTGPDLRQAVESTVDRMELARAFIRAPAFPQPRLLPPALMPQETLLRPSAPPPPAVPRPLTLLYDAQIPDHRAVAERLQVQLHDRGYRIVLKALPRAQLRSRWAQKDYELLLQGLLLPPQPATAFMVVLDAAGRSDLFPQELAALGALEDPSAREARVRERALALAPGLTLIPLYAQGLSVQSAPGLVQGLTRDAQGLPSLADLFLTPEP
ncbi:MAG: peptide ABC transporter substrate-binding protein [Myxococcaceae bacterium]